MPAIFTSPNRSRVPLLPYVLAGVLLMAAFELRPAGAHPIPSLEIVRIDEAEAPEIDGLLDDPIWKKAALIPNLTQQEPIEQVPPTEKTEVRLCYDSRNLYIAFRCFDSEPDRINASIMQRDQTVGADDYVAILIDPFETEREGYYFRLNPNGAKGDGRITELSRRVQMEWDAIWEGHARRDDQGWSVEFSIPFRSLSFPEEAGEWRMNFNRWIPRKQERNRWSGALLSRSFTKLEDAGFVTGFRDMERGIGVDLKPYGLGRWGDGRAGDGWESEFGGDIFWQITPSLTTTFTFNTDFAETEVDDRVVNLTRFPLFFPEKRDFFLEGSEYFEFGPFSTSLRAFHSRTIGLSGDLEKVPILAGAKVTGRAGPVGIGVFGAGLDSIPGLDKDKIGVGRITYDFGEHSRAGTFFSYGDPRGDLENWVAGVDYNYKNNNFFIDRQLDIDVFELMSDDAGEQAHSFGIDIEYPNNPVRWGVDLRQIDEDFRPAMGFVQRPGTRRGQAFARHRWYPEQIDGIRNFDIGSDFGIHTNLDNDIESINSDAVWFQIETETGDEFTVYPRLNREVLDEPFEISNGVILDPGDYHFNDFVASFETSNSRPVSLDVRTRIGNFWDGKRKGIETELEWRASKYFGAEIGGEYDDVDLESGEFEVLVGYAGFRVTPNPNLSWNLLAQWDNVSEEVGINSRIRWILAPGKDVYFVVNKGFEIEDDRSFRSVGTEVVAKVGWTFRF